MCQTSKLNGKPAKPILNRYSRDIPGRILTKSLQLVNIIPLQLVLITVKPAPRYKTREFCFRIFPSLPQSRIRVDETPQHRNYLQPEKS